MYRSYFLSALRHLYRYKQVSLLNILGLSVGIAVCVIIFLYVRFEMSYDRYHPDYERIYRVEKISNIYGDIEKYAAIPVFISDEIKQYDEVEYLGCFGSWRPQVVRYNDRVYKEDNILYADAELFRIFGINVVEGNPAEDLDRPFTVVLTETIARKYFDNQPGLGKTLRIDTNYFEVVGIVENFPYNSHVRMEIIMSRNSMNTLVDFPEEVGRFLHLPTYVKLHSWVDAAVFGERIYDLAHKLDPELFEKRGEDMKCFLRPVSDIHLHANQLKWDVDPGGNPVFLYLLSLIGLLILLITCFNYMNLSTARYSARSLEVGIRKVVGATRRSLINQFIGESITLVIIAHIIGMFIVEFTLPLLNRIGNLSLDIDYLAPVFLLFLISIILVIGIFAGSYPAFFLSSFKTVTVMKGLLGKHSKGNTIRRILVSGQYVISITLIMATMIVYKQLLFMKNTSLGFIKDNKLVIEFPEGLVTSESYRYIKDEFLTHSGARAATFSSSVPGRWRYYWRMWPTGEAAEKTRMMNCLQVDYDFIPVYGLEIIEGKTFDISLSDSSNRGYILNEAAVYGYDWESPENALTKTLNEYRTPVRGVFKNYHFKGLQNAIEPLGMYLIEDDFRYLTLVFEKRSVGSVITFSEETFTRLFPEAVFNYFFLDKDFESQYKQEESISKLVLIFTVLGIFIASLGLTGMVSFSLENRKKEMGIRKVNGARAGNIYNLLVRNFTLQILAAFFIACPVAWLSGKAWLHDFAYRTTLAWWIFVSAGLLAWVFAMATTSIQSLKAAGENPVDSLRYE